MKSQLSEILPKTILEKLQELYPCLPEGTKPATPNLVSPYWRKVERIAKIRPAVRAAYNILRNLDPSESKSAAFNVLEAVRILKKYGLCPPKPYCDWAR